MTQSDEVSKTDGQAGPEGTAEPEPEATPEAHGEDVPGPGKILGRTIVDDPKVVLFENFISEAEVQHLLALCESRWERSLVTKGKVEDLHGTDALETEAPYGKEGVGDSRTSFSVHVDWDESWVAERIAARVAAVAGTELRYVEPLVVVRYEPGQYFKLHHDGSMRPSTVFVYLNSLEPDGGGETYFPELEFQVRPVAHTAIMWRNRLDDGSADYRLQHEAKEVKKGVKYGMNCFVNHRPQRDTSNIVLVPVEGGSESEKGEDNES